MDIGWWSVVTIHFHHIYPCPNLFGIRWGFFFFFKFKAETKFNLKALCCLATTCFFGLTSLHAPLGSFCFIVLVFSFLKCLIPASATAPKALSLWPPAHPCSHAVIFQIPNPSSLPRKAFPTPSHGVIAAVLWHDSPSECYTSMDFHFVCENVFRRTVVLK